MEGGETMTAKVRKILVRIEETQRETVREIDPPTWRAAALAVIENPFAGRYHEEFDELMALGAELVA